MTFPTNNNDFISTLIAPATSAESCEIDATLLNLVMKDQFSDLPSEDAASHLSSNCHTRCPSVRT